MELKTYNDFVDFLQDKVGTVLMDVEIKQAAKNAQEIMRLKNEMNAVILGHNYMAPELFYTVTDFRGDSLDLCRKAATTEKAIIVFCGVRFMAETAKILNPDKTVLLPSQKAGCSLAEGITASDIRWLKKQFPNVPVVTYINSYADVKAESDICCTSSNAAAVVDSLNTDKVIFLPDEYLARNVALETGRHIIFPTKTERSKGFDLDYQMIGWNARCEVHEKFSVADIRQIRKQYPDVYVLAHPECNPEVIAEADFAGSTKQLIAAVTNSAAKQYLLLTECAMGDNIAAANPEKEILRLCNVRCPHMNKITLEDTLKALQKLQYVIDVPVKIRERARRAVERMLEVS